MPVMDKEKVLKLATLARIKLSDEEAESLSYEFEAILAYVGEVQSVEQSDNEPEPGDFPIRNIFRADGEGIEPGVYTEKILDEAPAREGDYVKVKKILS